MIVDTALELCLNGEDDERHYVYVLEFMLTLDKMQNISPLMCTKIEI